MRETQFISRDSSARHPDIGKPNPGPRRSNPGDGAVGKKISYLVHEGKPQKQAVAIALSMKRAGRLSKEGHYRRVGK